jgi:hypothetical protein
MGLSNAVDDDAEQDDDHAHEHDHVRRDLGRAKPVAVLRGCSKMGNDVCSDAAGKEHEPCPDDARQRRDRSRHWF